MKRLLSVLLALAMMLIFASCAGEYANLAGTYEAVSCTALGFDLDCEGEWLELKGNGKGTLCLMGEEYNCKWTLEGETFTLTNHGDAFQGTLHNGIITLDFGDMIYVYIMEETQMEDGTVKGHVHQWKEADCRNPRTCLECAATEGSAKGHDAREANYQDDSVCNSCGEVLAEKLQPDMEKYGIETFLEVGTIYPYTTITYKNENLATTGELIIDSYEVVKSAEEFPEREGYEWRIITGRIMFYDYNGRKNGFSIGYCYEDYYNIALSDDNEAYDEETDITTRMCSFHGEEMPYYIKEIGANTGWKYSSTRRCNENVHSFTRGWQVPVGYDGCVAGFYNKKNIVWEENHIYDLYNTEDFWLFRLN